MLRVRTIITAPTGSPYLSVFHFTSVADDQIAADAAASKVGNYWNEFRAVWLSTVSYSVQQTVDVVTPSSGQLTGQLSVAAHTGAGAVAGSDLLPPHVQGLVRFTTAEFVNGRRVRGRSFVPGLLESSNGPSGSPAGQLVTTTAPAAIVAILNAANAQLVVWSRPFTHVQPSDPPTRIGTTHVVTSGELQPKFAVLRSRRD